MSGDGVPLPLRKNVIFKLQGLSRTFISIKRWMCVPHTILDCLVRWRGKRGILFVECSFAESQCMLAFACLRFSLMTASYFPRYPHVGQRGTKPDRLFLLEWGRGIFSRYSREGERRRGPAIGAYSGLCEGHPRSKLRASERSQGP